MQGSQVSASWRPNGLCFALKLSHKRYQEPDKLHTHTHTQTTYISKLNYFILFVFATFSSSNNKLSALKLKT